MNSYVSFVLFKKFFYLFIFYKHMQVCFYVYLLFICFYLINYLTSLIVYGGNSSCPRQLVNNKN